MIPQSFIQDLLARIDIIDVIERHLTLKKSGANYFACCPFHGEKTPSFSISPSKQFYHCFGCGVNGNVIGFLMEYSGLSFVEAVHELARQSGLEVPQDDDPIPVAARQQARSRNERLLEAMATAARFYRERLRHSPAAIAYLKQRGLTGETAAHFGIGYAPDEWQALESVFPDYQSELLLEAGLVIENDKGRRYDRFRGRILFPIQDRRGRIIGFGGRVLDQGEPKYLNSPETPLFSKGNELYGIVQAQSSIRSAGHALVVEGYMDVVALAQHGIANAVATLGTATTSQHVKNLLRHTERIVFCFDGDAAGRKAAWRALESSLEVLRDDVTLAFLFLPAEHDPDSFVQAQGADAVRKAADAATPLASFLLEELTHLCDLETAEGRARLVHLARPLVTRVAAPLLRLQLIKALADTSGLTQGETEEALGLARTQAPRRSAPRGERTPTRTARSGRAATRRAPPSAAATLLRLCLQRPAWIARIPVALVPGNSDVERALTALIDAVGIGDLDCEMQTTMLVEHFRQTPHHAPLSFAAAELLETHYDENIIETLFDDTMRKLAADTIDREIQALMERERTNGLQSDERRRLANLLQERRQQGESGNIDIL